MSKVQINPYEPDGCVSDILNELTDADLSPICDTVHQDGYDAVVTLATLTNSFKTSRQPWHPRNPLHNWEHVTLDRDGRVIKLQVQGGGTSQELGEALEQLDTLVELHILGIYIGNYIE